MRNRAKMRETAPKCAKPRQNAGNRDKTRETATNAGNRDKRGKPRQNAGNRDKTREREEYENPWRMPGAF